MLFSWPGTCDTTGLCLSDRFFLNSTVRSTFSSGAVERAFSTHSGRKQSFHVAIKLQLDYENMSQILTAQLLAIASLAVTFAPPKPRALWVSLFAVWCSATGKSFSAWPFLPFPFALSGWWKLPFTARIKDKNSKALNFNYFTNNGSSLELE